MSFTEGLYAVGDFITGSFELVRMLGSGLPYGGVVNWLLIIIGVGITAWWMKKMTGQTEDFEANRPS